MDKEKFSWEQQLKEIMKHSKKDDKILEIGIGSGTVSNMLRKRGFDVTTMDIDKNKNPDIVGNVQKMPFKDNSFTTVLCAELLEHIPFNNKLFVSLRELKRVSRKYIIVSLPYNDTALIYKLKALALSILGRPMDSAGHYWELNLPFHSTQYFKALLEQIGFDVIKHYRFEKNPYHYFFILEVERHEEKATDIRDYPEFEIEIPGIYIQLPKPRADNSKRLHKRGEGGQ